MAEAWRDHPWRWVWGVHTPKLTEIPQEQWREVLITYDRDARFKAAFDLYLTPEQRAAARELILELPPPPSERVRQEMPRVGFGHRPGRPPTSRQLNLRIAQEDYESLATAARLLGTKPTQVARMLINAGVRRLLAEYDVTIDGVTSTR
jgi:hypothetical protein